MSIPNAVMAVLVSCYLSVLKSIFVLLIPDLNFYLCTWGIWNRFALYVQINLVLTFKGFVMICGDILTEALAEFPLRKKKNKPGMTLTCPN